MRNNDFLKKLNRFSISSTGSLIVIKIPLGDVSKESLEKNSEFKDFVDYANIMKWIL